VGKAVFVGKAGTAGGTDVAAGAHPLNKTIRMPKRTIADGIDFFMLSPFLISCIKAEQKWQHKAYSDTISDKKSDISYGGLRRVKKGPGIWEWRGW
jgi:hypothetical protein